MPEEPIDLRSDTVTRPTPAMRAAMASAEVGDDWAGEDPTVRALEEEVAALFGHEAAVYVPSGTMSNNIALRLLADRGDEVLADNDSHVVTYEMGGLAALGGIQTRTLVSTVGILTPETIEAQLRSGAENYSRVTTRALAIENTHVRSGGRSWNLAAIDAVVAVTAPAGVALHCDGARIWNASVATGIPLEEYGRRFATLSVCMSKGLGAPVGSLVVTSAELARRARLLRRQLGGAMRQSGIIAAGALYALHHHLDRLAEDHRRAAFLAEALTSARASSEGISYGGSNIVLVTVADADRFVADAAARGVRVGTISRSVVRAVTHLDVSDEDAARAGAVLAELVARG